MTIYYQDKRLTLYHGDCIEVMRSLPDASVDAVVTDPPYDLTYGKRGGTGPASVNLDSPYGRSRIGTGNGGFMGLDWDSTGVAFNVDTWREALRVLKPGGHLLAFGGTRTWHRLACAVEDAGFEVRDSIAWLYGSGFPKSLDVSKAIDKAAGAEREVVGPSLRHVGKVTQRLEGLNGSSTFAETPGMGSQITAPATPDAERWQGWGTALKPAFEPIVVARKPLIGTVAANVLAHGTGALNIDGCRIGTTETLGRAKGGWGDAAVGATNYGNFNSVGVTVEGGRWPANVVLDESQAEALDEQSGETSYNPPGKFGTQKVDSRAQGSTNIGPRGEGDEIFGYGDRGGASRFFYVAKADANERPRLPKRSLRLRDDLTPEQVDHVRARLVEAGVQVD